LQEVGYSTGPEQAIAAISCASSQTLEPFVYGVISAKVVERDVAIQALSDRASSSRSLSDTASAIRGLRSADNTLVASDWLKSLGEAGIPKKAATISALLGLLPSADMPDIGDMRTFAEYGRSLFNAVANCRIPKELVDAAISTLEATTSESAEHYSVVLSSLSRAPLND
jgi:hypothetical protein